MGRTIGQWGLVLLLAGAVGCGASAPSEQNARANEEQTAAGQTFAGSYPIQIVTTCGMVTDIVRNVAGEKAEVTGLMGEGVDPHLYKPTRNDVKKLMEADLVFYAGLMLEGRMTDLFTKLARRGQPVYPVTEGLDRSYLRTPEEFQGHYDPHVWMDVKAWSRCTAFTAEVLGDFDPPNAEFYANNAESYRAKLEKLDAYVQRVIATIPEKQRVLVTAHDAFGYFSRAYEIPVNSVLGLTTTSEAGVEDINRLVDFIVERKVPAIFVETSISEKNIRAVIEGAARKDWQVEIGGSLFSDAMGEPGTYEGTYIGMMDHNATVITRALGGEAPAKGMQGRLNRD